MSARRALGAVIVLGVFAGLGLADVPKGPARRSLYATQFPDGPGKAIADRSCLMCHAATLVTQQAKDSTGWEKTLATMEKWGAGVNPSEHDTLRTYLLEHFGPRKNANERP